MQRRPTSGEREEGAELLRAPFDAVTPFTVGLEEEAMLLDESSFDLVPRAPQVLDRLAGDGRFKPELPASQVELVTEPRGDVTAALELLAGARRDLVRAAEGIAAPVAVPVHPFAPGEGELSAGDHYEGLVGRFGPVAHRQLVAALQVHVAVGGADRTIAVHDALRCFLPELAALAANAPFHEGRDSGMASIRPLLSQQLPRQGIPPAIGSWDTLASELAWGRRSGAVPEPAVWWWELRPHLTHGTLEVRVPDVQTTLSAAAGVAATVQALVAWLAAGYDEGRPLPAAPDWRIAENRWSALRHGLDGELADLRSGTRQSTRRRLIALLETLEPVFEELGSRHLFGHAEALTRRNGAAGQRSIVAGGADLRALTARLARVYADPLPDVWPDRAWASRERARAGRS